ncbi:MAG: hemolysin [Chthoniobacteraceae bacterium]|nr:hemolysin [Chthoniobacteraceae bacterium]
MDSDNSYTVRLARSASDVAAAQALRFRVFNIERDSGLQTSYLTGLDQDLFDPVCAHLLVEKNGEVVGTYRMQTGRSAALNNGYYSAREFDFEPFEPLRDQFLEVGRACVARSHRNLIVLGMLWRGIAAYARDHGCRYLIGCSSLDSVAPREGASLFWRLSRTHLASPDLSTVPNDGWHCSLDNLSKHPPRTPKLLSAYLSIGAQICAPPAIDTEFKTIDFLTLLDMETLPSAIQQLLF